MRIEYSKGERASKELILLNRQSFEASSGRKMKVMLIFPPDWFPSEPYLSLPSLTAVLRQAGHTVVQKDINLEMWDWYFSEDFLKKVLRRVPRQLDRLRKALSAEPVTIAAVPESLRRDWVAPDGMIRRFGCQYRGMDYPNEDITCKGVVTKKYEANGERLVDVEIWTENPKGQKTTPGFATVAFK